MKLYSKGYTIKQRFTGVLAIALVPVMLLSMGLTEVICRVAEVLKLWKAVEAVAYKEGLFLDWYIRLLESVKKK